MTAADSSDVLGIEQKCFAHAAWKNAMSFLRGKMGDSYVVCDDANIIVGFLVVRESDNGKEIDIVKMATHPDFQGKGVGTFSLSWCKKYAADKRMKRVSLRVRKSNKKAIGLYRRAGFTTIEEHLDYYAKGETADDKTAVEMQMTLTE